MREKEKKGIKGGANELTVSGQGLCTRDKSRLTRSEAHEHQSGVRGKARD